MVRGPLNDALISIKPEFAARILDGDKTVELRRRIPSIAVGTRLWIYATLPLGAIVGTANVRRIVRGAPTQIWHEWAEESGVSRREYRAYFLGANEAVALLLSNVRRTQPVSIDELRRLWRGFQPPQVMAQLTNSEAKSLQTLGKLAA